MSLKNKKSKWWLINGIFFLLIGGSGLALIIFQPQMLTTIEIFDVFLNTIIGVFLLKQKSWTFWLAVLVAVLSFFSSIIEVISSASVNWLLAVRFLTVLSLWMLWEEIRVKKGKS